MPASLRLRIRLRLPVLLAPERESETRPEAAWAGDVVTNTKYIIILSIALKICSFEQLKYLLFLFNVSLGLTFNYVKYSVSVLKAVEE